MKRSKKRIEGVMKRGTFADPSSEDEICKGWRTRSVWGHVHTHTHSGTHTQAHTHVQTLLRIDEGPTTEEDAE